MVLSEWTVHFAIYTHPTLSLPWQKQVKCFRNFQSLVPGYVSELAWFEGHFLVHLRMTGDQKTDWPGMDHDIVMSPKIYYCKWKWFPVSFLSLFRINCMFKLLTSKLHAQINRASGSFHFRQQKNDPFWSIFSIKQLPSSWRHECEWLKYARRNERITTPC